MNKINIEQDINTCKLDTDMAGGTPCPSKTIRPTPSTRPRITPTPTKCASANCSIIQTLDTESCICTTKYIEYNRFNPISVIPCEKGINDLYNNVINSLDIEGYAFYSTNINDSQYISTKNADDSVLALAPCAGGHRCNAQEFIVKLTFKDNNNIIEQFTSDKIINLNNKRDGENREDNFNIKNINPNLFAYTATVSLECILPKCHYNPIWIILATTYNRKTNIIFNKCIPIDSEENLLNYTCYNNNMLSQTLPYIP